MQNSADHPPIVHAFFASNVCWQVRLDSRPLFVAQPEQVASHCPLREIAPQRIINRFAKQGFY
jgi:hypothetical protein